MWYHAWNGISGSNNIRIGHATSTDAVSWAKDTLNNPVLSCGIWDSPRVDAPRVVFVDTIFHMWYLGGNIFTWRIGHATSSDGSVWIKDSLNNPVLGWGVPNTWDDYGLGFCSVLFDSLDEEFKIWYSGFDNPWSSRIGYATSCIDTISVFINDLQNNNNKRYILSQNYPNPFNPVTTIEFDLPKTSEVSLKVFNILGEEVTTLVSDKLYAGSYTYKWDASNLASGVYLYRLEAEDFVETMKMILMK
jgi:hypothetical protein